MGVVHVQFECQGMGGCSCMRVVFTLSNQNTAKIKENVMMSLMQWWNGGDDDLKHPGGRYGGGPRPI